jgi:hypothetical protein
MADDRLPVSGDVPDIEVGAMIAVGPGMGLLQDAIGAARDRQRRTWLTDRGHRVAAIVPAGDLEYWERGSVDG